MLLCILNNLSCLISFICTEELKTECLSKPSKPSKGCLEEKEMIKQLRQELNKKDQTVGGDTEELEYVTLKISLICK